MNVLGYIIPAIREVRGPLIGGYIWLAAVWAAFGDTVPDDPRPGTIWATFERLDSVVGTGGIVVALSVAGISLAR
jgi:hypothetical protein